MNVHARPVSPLAVPFSRLGLLAMVAMAVVITGCPDPNDIHGQDPASLVPGKTSMYDMARSMGLTVNSHNDTMVRLRNTANTVDLYSDPCGQAFVNGRPVGQMGGFTTIGDVLYVPDENIASIRRSLRSSAIGTGNPWEGHDIPGSDNPGPGTGTNEPPKPHAKGKVVIDPGHGGKDGGTLASKLIEEKNVNLAVSLLVGEMLKSRGVTVVYTRSDDRFIDLDERVAISNRSGANLFVAIHSDAAEDRAVAGHTIIVPESPSNATWAAAGEISKYMVAAGSERHSVHKDVRGLRVLRYAKIPAVLVELGFLSNSKEAARLADKNYQHKLASAIADGIVAYLNRK